ncbi:MULTISPECIES: VanW family protein [Gracilibacillus]|uniref:VanW family protein n=1 Tax=Gracilibacillus TaxID=74385 RepID=UPI000826AB77|nr:MULTISPECIES: VanW family protein [Gracilibacillus]
MKPSFFIAYFIALVLPIAQPMEEPDRLTITHQGEIIATIDRENFSLPFTGTPLINMEKLDRLVEELDQQIYMEPVNATINDQEEIDPGQLGYGLDKKAFKKQFYAYFIESKSATLEVPVLEIYPKVDSELLANVRMQKIGQYVTYFNANNQNRTHNIQLSAEAVDNYVIFPNEIFSFNEVVGERTVERGYKRSTVIVKGELAEDVGGGICQVSSTLFNAVDGAGLEIVERYAHSRRVKYVPPGRDATVSWHGPDFRFQNMYNQPILIRSKRYEGTVVITLHSSDVINYDSRSVPKAPTKIPEEESAGD